MKSEYIIAQYLRWAERMQETEYPAEVISSVLSASVFELYRLLPRDEADELLDAAKKVAIEEVQKLKSH